MNVDRHHSRHRDGKTNPLAKHAYTGYIEPTAAGETITWGTWSDTPTERRTMAITLFPYSSGSDYMGSVVEQSNYRVLAEDEHVMRRSVLIEGGYSTFGVAFIGYPTRRIRAIVSALESYPLLDEDAHSELECEIETREWASYGRAEFRRDMVTEFGDGLDEILDGLDEGFTPTMAVEASYETRVAPSVRLLDATWHAFSEHHGDMGRIFEAPDSCHFYIDDAIKWLRSERDLGFALVLGSIEYREQGTFSVAKDAALEGRLDAAREILATWPDLVLVELSDDETEASEATE